LVSDVVRKRIANYELCNTGITLSGSLRRNNLFCQSAQRLRTTCTGCGLGL